MTLTQRTEPSLKPAGRRNTTTMAASPEAVPVNLILWSFLIPLAVPLQKALLKNLASPTLPE